jgi:cyclic beta-1,2-glucan synthetase
VHIVAEYDAANQALLARNSFNQEFGDQVVFLTGSLPIHGLTTDRGEFLGREGSVRDPVALRRIGLSGNLEPGSDPCAAVQLHVDLPAHADTELFFVLGRAQDRAQAAELLGDWRRPERIEAAWRETNEFWDELLGVVQVSTPDRAMDIVLNRWLLYQTVACRLWGRSAFYQSSGAYGFRDQLQDAMALVHARPDVLRGQLLEAARHQFEEGDVLHWWHPPGGQGVRTRFSDDLAWLPFATAHYLDSTGDPSVLEETLPYLTGPTLPEGVDENYDSFRPGQQTGTLYEHCLRAIDRACTVGPRGLPLMGSGDWNDGMNRVGAGGTGESVWLAWFLINPLQRFAAVCEGRGDTARADAYRSRAESYRNAVEAQAWDGEWYVRAFYDDGTPLGSHLSDEPKIDALAQAWSVLSEAGDPARQRRAMQAVRERLVDETNDLILLLKPPFDRGSHDPGYIKGYPPGVRENGGQYTHAAVWTVWALADLEGGRDAAGLFAMINPIGLADSRARADRYRVEPYVVAADVYGVPPHIGKGGWTWYTGSAAWLYRLGVERLLGITRHGDTLHVDPRVPCEWPGYAVTYRHGASVYRIEVEPVPTGEPADDAGDRITLVDDGKQHTITLRPRRPAATV